MSSKSTTSRESPGERLQKFLARAGIASRRAAEELINAGRVRVNDQVAVLGQRVATRDRVTVDGHIVTMPEAQITFALHKPRGILSTAQDEFGRRNVLELVPRVPGLHPVGRLDRQSSGLLLLTTDGELTLHLTHPRFGIEKEYFVVSDPSPTNAQLKALLEGIMLEDGPARAQAIRLEPRGVRLVLTEGRNREVRRMFAALDLEVLRLVRTRIGLIQLGDLRPGEWRVLAPEEVESLREIGNSRHRKDASPSQ